jgi:plasmid stability protein
MLANSRALLETIMQVSLYLDDTLIRRLDKLADRTGKSRSATVQSLLEHALVSDEGPALLALAGSWKDVRPAEQIIREVTEGRRYNRRSEQLDR